MNDMMTTTNETAMPGMKAAEKAEMLRNTIRQLYSNEGRSKSYISRLLEINRKTLAEKIREWNLPEPKPVRHLTPSSQKFLNKHRQLIKSRLDHDIPITEIADELGVSRDMLGRTIIGNDDVLKKARDDMKARAAARHEEYHSAAMGKSDLEYDYPKIAGEIWKPILGYSRYEISNYGRLRAYAKRYKAHYLIKQAPNKNNGRMYACIVSDSGERKNLLVARIVAHVFVPGHDEEHNTVNHKDGDIRNNAASNLEWVSQGENNTHSYKELGRSKVCGKRYEFSKLVYQDRYEFKTVAAFARFIGKSETQARRYIDEPEKHNIKLVI